LQCNDVHKVKSLLSFLHLKMISRINVFGILLQNILWILWKHFFMFKMNSMNKKYSKAILKECNQ
jgi:hypothetical protein